MRVIMQEPVSSASGQRWTIRISEMPPDLSRAGNYGCGGQLWNGRMNSLFSAILAKTCLPGRGSLRRCRGRLRNEREVLCTAEGSSRQTWAVKGPERHQWLLKAKVTALNKREGLTFTLSAPAIVFLWVIQISHDTNILRRKPGNSCHRDSSVCSKYLFQEPSITKR